MESNRSNKTVFDPYDYRCNEGLILPAISEYTWPTTARVVLYVVGMLWCFFAVAIIADVFMCSIERITSTTRTVRTPDPTSETGYTEEEVLVWNSTVANLSLMALGTSAPEILLSVIETLGKGMKAGELGPGTIVGSAAFNLLFITAICIVCIPEGETRPIANIKVFTVTAISGIFAYVWLAFVLLGTSPNEVEIWEAAATLIFFPTLLVVAYLADRNCFRDEQAAPQRKLSSSSAISVTVITKDSTTSSRISMTSQNVTQSANPNQSESVSEGGDEDEEEEEEENFEPTSSLDEASSEAITDTVNKAAGSLPVIGPTIRRSKSKSKSRVKSKARLTIPDRTVIEDDACSTRRSSALPRAEAVAKALALNHNIDEDTAAKLTAMQMNEEKPRSRYWYRINAARIIGGARKLQRKVSSSAAHEAEMAMAAVTDHADGGGRTIVEFSTSGVAVMDGETLARVSIRRRGKQDTTFKVRVETLSGTAVAGETFEPLEEVITFKAGETLKRTHITIHASSMVRANEFFYVKLHLEGESEAQIGENAICSVTIINYKEPGVLAFSKPSLIVKNSSLWTSIPVLRIGGAEGEVSVQWCTKDITAIAGQAYEPGDGVLVFEPGELHKSIEIILYPIQQAERDDSFAVLLLDARGGATLGRLTTCVVTIISDDEYNEIVNRIVTKAAAESDPLQSDTSYADQFRQAFNVNGGELDTATFQDYVLHFITFFWKVLFAFVPPPRYCGGWAAFIVSLAMIGLLTAIIGDLASIFGCLVGVEDAITAITFVALGTSMPDTFASMLAATAEPTADSSVGNVNGSNSVNVFLGLGLPWMISSIYWHIMEGRPHYVPAGSLGFSVVVFSTMALLAILILMVRRFTLGAELGGPKIPKYISGFLLVCLWGSYVLLSILKAKGVIQFHVG